MQPNNNKEWRTVFGLLAEKKPIVFWTLIALWLLTLGFLILKYYPH